MIIRVKMEIPVKTLLSPLILTFNMMKLSVKTLIIKLLTRFDVLKNV